MSNQFTFIAPSGGGDPDIPPATEVHVSLATLNGLTLDCSTADGDGIYWSYTTIEGWFDGADIRTNQQEVQPYGTELTVARYQGRAITLNGMAHALAKPSPAGKLGSKCFKATRTLKRFAALLATPGLLAVNEGDITLQAYVRLIGPVRQRIIEPLAWVEFQIPLLAPDPRRYAATATSSSTLQLTGSGTTVTQTLVNNGDLPTPLTITIDGPATHPMVVNNTAYLNPSVRYTGTLGGADTLVLDMGVNGLTATLNGTTDVIADLESSISGPPSWWQLRPGNNSITYSRTGGSGTSTAQADYRDAYT